MREKVIEDYLVKATSKIGGRAYKFESPGRRGVPDRICVFPHGVVVFVECKSPTGRLSVLQDEEIKYLRRKGQQAVVINSRPKVDKLMEWVREQVAARKAVKVTL